MENVVDNIEDLEGFNLREHRKARRREALDRLVPDRRCPRCARVFTASRSWVLRHDRAVCRSCHWKESSR